MLVQFGRRLMVYVASSMMLASGVRWRRCCDVRGGVRGRRCGDVDGVVERWNDGGVVGCKQVVGWERVGCRRCGGCEWVLTASVANFWREKHDGMEARWGNDGAWWLLVVYGLKTKTDQRKTAN